MPTIAPTISWQQLRNYMEQWTWRQGDCTVTGFNPPEKARDKRQKPFYFRAVTGKGEVIGGEAVCLKVFNGKEHQRMVRFTQSGQVRRIRDYLVMEVNGIRVVTH